MPPAVHGMPISGGNHTVWLLSETENMPLEFKFLNLMDGSNKAPEFLAINPMHCIPTLTDDETGVQMWETNAILRYLATKNKSETYPSDLKLRAACDVMLDHRNNHVVKHLGYCLLYPNVGFGGPQTQEQEDAAIKAWTEDGWPAMKKYIDQNGGPMICGSKVSIADMSIFGYVNLLISVRPNLKIFTDDACPGFTKWIDAVKAAVAYDKVYTEERIGFWQSKKMDK